jgi:dihydrofolate reductase
LGLIDEYQLTTVPIAIGAGRSPFAELKEHLKLDVVEEERFGAEPWRRSWCRSPERHRAAPDHRDAAQGGDAGR